MSCSDFLKFHIIVNGIVHFNLSYIFFLNNTLKDWHWHDFQKLYMGLKLFFFRSVKYFIQETHFITGPYSGKCSDELWKFATLFTHDILQFEVIKLLRAAAAYLQIYLHDTFQFSGTCHTYGGGPWPPGQHCCHCGSQVSFFSYKLSCFCSLWTSLYISSYDHKQHP